MKILSIITPVYNRADSVARCLDSIISQETVSGWRYEHVVVDDGSTDASAEIVRSYGDAVSFEALPENRGTNAARNAAIRRATGEWIVFLDSDDMALPGALAIICRTIDSNPGYLHYIFSVDDFAEANARYGRRYEFTFEDFLLERVFGDFVHVFRRQTALDFPFREDLRIFEGIFFLHYYRTAKKILFTGETLFARDRCRADHVSFSLYMTTDKALRNKIISNELRVDLYADDYRRTPEGREMLRQCILTVYSMSVLAGDYDRADRAAAQLDRRPKVYAVLCALHAGPTAWRVLRRVVALKHRLRR